MNNSKKQIQLGAFLSYIQVIFSIIITLVYTPYLVKLLGKNEYGLYNTVISTMSMLYILSFGFNNSYIKFYAKYKTEGLKKNIERLNGLMFIIFFGIGVLALICGLLLSFNLKLVFKDGLTYDELILSKKMVLVLTIFFIFFFPGNVYTQIISAHERFIFLRTFQIIRTVAIPVLSVFALYCGYRSLALVIVSSLVAVVIDFVFLGYVLFVLKERFDFRKIEKSLFISLTCYTSFIAINIIIDQINWNLDKVLLGRYCGTSAVAIYTIGSIIHTCFQRFSTSISSVFTPRIHKIIAENSVESQNKITSLFITVGRIQYIILGLVFSSYVIFGRSFINMWVGGDFGQSYYVGLLLMAAVMIPLTQNIGIEVIRAKNIHKYICIIYFFIVLSNTLLTILLCPKFGAMGAAIGTAFSICMGEILVLNFFYKKLCKIDIFLFWKNIIRLSAGLIMPIIAGVFLYSFSNIDSIICLLSCAFAYLILYCTSMWFFGINRDEKCFVISCYKKVASFLKSN